MKFFELLGKTGAVLVVLLVWLVALGLMAGAMNQGYKLQTATVKNNLVQSAKLASVNITETPLGSEEYQKAADQLKARYTTMVITVSGSGLSISAPAEEDYYLWTSTLLDATAIFPDSRWTINSFCVGQECTGDKPFNAEISAIRKRPTIVDDNLDSLTPAPVAATAPAPAAPAP